MRALVDKYHSNHLFSSHVCCQVIYPTPNQKGFLWQFAELHILDYSGPYFGQFRNLLCEYDGFYLRLLAPGGSMESVCLRQVRWYYRAHDLKRGDEFCVRHCDHYATSSRRCKAADAIDKKGWSGCNLCDRCPVSALPHRLFLLVLTLLVALHFLIITRIDQNANSIAYSACISSILRLIYTVKLSHTQDVSYAIAPVGMWAQAEYATVILCACFPTFPRFFRFITKRDNPTKRSQELPEQSPKTSSSSTKPVRDPYPLEDTKQDSTNLDTYATAIVYSHA